MYRVLVLYTFMKVDFMRHYSPFGVVTCDILHSRYSRAVGKTAPGILKGSVASVKAFLGSLWAGGSALVLILIICMGIIGGALFSESSSAEPLSAEVLAYTATIRRYADQYGIGEYVSLIQAVMMQESGGKGLDPMQSSESGYNTRYPRIPGGITDPEYSIECGVQAVRASLAAAGVKNPMDMEHIRLALQNYNFGNGYAEWAKDRYGGYSVANAAEFFNMMAARLGWSGDKLGLLPGGSFPLWLRYGYADNGCKHRTAGAGRRASSYFVPETRVIYIQRPLYCSEGTVPGRKSIDYRTFKMLLTVFF